MAFETTNYQCISCNGPLHFSSESGLLECDYCGSKFTPAQIEEYYARSEEKHEAAAAAATAAEAKRNAQAAPEEPANEPAQNAAPDKDFDPIQNYLNRSKWEEGEQDNLRSFTCSSCGAELLTDTTTAVTQCPYCGNPTVLPGQLNDTLRPEFVIPFRQNKDQAVAALKEYYKGKKFLPDNFTKGNHLEEVQGVYVPFWLYTASAEGSATFTATNSTYWSDSENDYVETEFYDATREGTMDFEKVPVDASSKMPDAHMDAIEPFDYSDLQPFSMGYLPGYLTDRYDEDASMCQSRAQGRIEQTTVDLLRETVTGYDSVYPKSSSVDPTWEDATYALLPVWMLHTKYNDKDLLFAMNGQTGRLIGDLPVDKGKVVFQFLIVFLPVLAVLIAIICLFLLK